MFNEVCGSSANSFVSKKLRVNYGILDEYRATAGAVKVAVAFLVKVVTIFSVLLNLRRLKMIT